MKIIDAPAQRDQSQEDHSVAVVRPIDLDDGSRGGRRLVLPVVALAALSLLLLVLVLRSGTPAAVMANFALLFQSLLIGALPLVLIGAVVAGVIATFVPTAWFARISALPEWLQLPVAAVSGFAFPVCECGSIPVARRLIARGLRPSAAVTFMLASPIVNPIVLLSTYIAYRGRASMVAVVGGRAVLGFLAAIAVGWVLANRSAKDMLRGGLASEDDANCGCASHDCDHSHADGHAHDHDHDHDESRGATFVSHATGELLFMARFLILGSAIAAAIQTILPQSVLQAVSQEPILAVISLMALAFILSLCSESDAFVAASFVQFGTAAQLAFLVFGPMFDIRLALMYRATFGRGFVPLTASIVAVAALGGALWIGVIAG